MSEAQLQVLRARLRGGIRLEDRPIPELRETLRLDRYLDARFSCKGNRTPWTAIRDEHLNY